MNKKVLIIEDNFEISENLKELLEIEGYSVHSEENGVDGLSAVDKYKPDLILCDILMPGIDGYEVLEALSKHDLTANIPFIFLTSKSEQEDINKGMKLGATNFICKPFDEHELLNIIKSKLFKAGVINLENDNNMVVWNKFFCNPATKEPAYQLTESIEKISIKKGVEIFKQSTYPRCVYMICCGLVKLSIANNLGKEVITGLYGKGDFIGCTSVLKGVKHSNTATALKDTEVCVIQKNDFLNLINSDINISKKFIQLLTDNVVQKETQIVSLTLMSSRKRVAEALMTLKSRNQDSKNPFIVNINRENLANMTGVATETVVRILSAFKKEKLIDARGSNITLINDEKLQTLIN
jgi:CheY-like chemotaxis protein